MKHDKNEIVIKKSITLPKYIIEKLDAIPMSSQDRDYCLKFLDCLIVKSKQQSRLINNMVDMPSNYIRKAINHRYTRWLYPLLDAKIVLSDNSYNTNTHKPLYYSINLNTQLMDSMSCTYPVIDCETVVYNRDYVIEKPKEKKLKKSIIEDLETLYFDYTKMSKIVEDVVKGITRDKFKINSEITEKSVYARYNSYGKERECWLKIGVALQMAKEWGVDLIQDGVRYYICDFKNYLDYKRQSYYLSYTDGIDKFKNKDFYAFRNDTNNRLDSNITNMANVLTDELFKDNGLIKFDLSNSQFAILSHSLDKKLQTEDFNIFKREAYAGTLYEYIQDKLELESRKEAKNMMFELMFSSEKLKSALKTKLKKLFPSVVKYVDDYKRKHKYKNFSISLQKIESEIFIDGIWQTIKKEKVFCLTKHDSIIVRKENRELAINVIRDHFEKINFKGRIVEE